VKHREILTEYFRINSALKGWVALETSDAKQLPGYGTNRIAKVEDDDKFYFTLGGTIQGRRRSLNDRIREIITGQGLLVIETVSTDTDRPDAVYLGFSLNNSSEAQLRQIVEQVRRTVRSM